MWNLSITSYPLFFSCTIILLPIFYVGLYLFKNEYLFYFILFNYDYFVFMSREGISGGDKVGWRGILLS